ncbi:hypothetical protein F5X99DRAFT_370922 [Biscogniauxia marginata]|nr:hypothetical protein F5X99DRAFT_370922 [Biscogniauxia marginata]
MAESIRSSSPTLADSSFPQSLFTTSAFPLVYKMAHQLSGERTPLTPDEEKVMLENESRAQLTEEQRAMFDAWVGAKEPTVSEAKHWIAKNTSLDFNTFSFTYLNLLIKQAVWKSHAEATKALKKLVVRRPGFGLPLGHMPGKGERFPVLFLGGDEYKQWKAATLLIRERCMLMLVNELSEKPEWWRKVKDDEITARWKKEALEMKWASYLRYADFTPAMADACIAELRKKAYLYENTGLMPVYDYSAAVIKSDSILTPELAKSLQDAIKTLEDVPQELKDWHPNSNEQVLDLVHPSLWPLTYGRSRVLQDRTIGVEDALAHCGMGTKLRSPAKSETNYFINNVWNPMGVSVLSNKFQWLPCDVNLDPSTGKVKISSYINNLHPEEHAHLYPIIEQFIEKSLPAWDVLYSWDKYFAVQRLKTAEVGKRECSCPEICGNVGACKPQARPLAEGEIPRTRKNPARKKLDKAWFEATHGLKLPNADPEAKEYVKIGASDVKSKGFFDEKQQIQVIVKLANIHLTPEKPSYDGGSWHTEGQLNEHIVSTALYYYDSDNITDCTLDFRTCANKEELSAELNYEQYDHDSISRTFAIQSRGSTIQDIGSVLTKAGRALFFPNLLQHHVSPFKLADPTRPGHRKILALFLVDPAIPITSTSNVPPQQKHWWTSCTGLNSGRGTLPPEVVEMVTDNVEWPIGWEEAKKLRLELMSERTWFKQQEEVQFEKLEWDFCEH